MYLERSTCHDLFRFKHKAKKTKIGKKSLGNIYIKKKKMEIMVIVVVKKNQNSNKQK